jgi:hypothetical protein
LPARELDARMQQLAANALASKAWIDVKVLDKRVWHLDTDKANDSMLRSRNNDTSVCDRFLELFEADTARGI